MNTTSPIVCTPPDGIVLGMSTASVRTTRKYAVLGVVMFWAKTGNTFIMFLFFQRVHHLSFIFSITEQQSALHHYCPYFPSSLHIFFSFHYRTRHILFLHHCTPLWFSLHQCNQYFSPPQQHTILSSVAVEYISIHYIFLSLFPSLYNSFSLHHCTLC